MTTDHRCFFWILGWIRNLWIKNRQDNWESRPNYSQLLFKYRPWTVTSSIASNARLNPYWLPWPYNIKSGCHFLITRLLKPPSCSDSSYLRDIDWASGQVLSWSTSCHTHCLLYLPLLPLSHLQTSGLYPPFTII